MTYPNCPKCNNNLLTKAGFTDFKSSSMKPKQRWKCKKCGRNISNFSFIKNRNHNPSKYWLGKKRDAKTILKIKKARAKQILPKRTPEWNKKIGDAQRGEKNHMWGKKPSRETRMKLHLVNKGRILSKITEDGKRRIRKFRKTQVLPTKDTSIEIKIQNFLKQLGIEFLTHQYINEIKYSYQCDIFIPKQKGINQKTIIECDGDYWHGNPEFNRNFMKYSDKIRKTRCLDYERTFQLKEKGFRVIRLWGSDIKSMKLNSFKNKIYG